jgi:hypothetical protein
MSNQTARKYSTFGPFVAQQIEASTKALEEASIKREAALVQQIKAIEEASVKREAALIQQIKAIEDASIKREADLLHKIDTSAKALEEASIKRETEITERLENIVTAIRERYEEYFKGEVIELLQKMKAYIRTVISADRVSLHNEIEVKLDVLAHGIRVLQQKYQTDVTSDETNKETIDKFRKTYDDKITALTTTLKQGVQMYNDGELVKFKQEIVKETSAKIDVAVAKTDLRMASIEAGSSAATDKLMKKMETSHQLLKGVMKGAIDKSDKTVGDLSHRVEELQKDLDKKILQNQQDTIQLEVSLKDSLEESLEKHTKLYDKLQVSSKKMVERLDEDMKSQLQDITCCNEEYKSDTVAAIKVLRDDLDKHVATLNDRIERRKKAYHVLQDAWDERIYKQDGVIKLIDEKVKKLAGASSKSKSSYHGSSSPSSKKK